MEQNPFLTAASAYVTAGWPVLALPPGQKFPPPRNYTGADGVDASFADLYTWADEHPDANLGLRMPENVIGLDVDHYGDKRGGDTIASFEAQWGPLPKTWRTTSRTDEHSGIRLYRVSPGARLRDRLGDAVEIVRREHRYAMAWPSVHPNGGTYGWVNPDGERDNIIPEVDDLPLLPPAWERGLEAARLQLVADADQLDGIDFATEGDMSDQVEERLRKAIADLNGPGSRHDATRDHVLRLMAMSANGQTGVREALTRLGKAFVAAVSDRIDADGAQREFGGMITNPRGKQLIAASLQQAQSNSIWDATPYLSQIRDAAYIRLLSPAVVLGVVIAYRLGQVGPHFVIPPIVGAPGSLNFYTALWGPPGGGKTAALALGRELLETNEWTAPPGSGEKIPGLFAVPNKDDESGVEFIRRRATIDYDEITSLGGMMKRSGSTLTGMFLSAWAGQALGAQHQDASRTHPVPAHSYRLTMTVGVQPRNAHTLTALDGSGLPQRFLWVNAIDPVLGNLAERPPGEVVPLRLRDIGVPQSTALWPRRDIHVCDTAVQAVLDTRFAYLRGEVLDANSHRLLMQMKVAAALSILAPDIDVPEVSEETWALAGRVLAELHDPTLALAMGESSRQAKAAARSAGELDAERAGAFDDTRIKKAAKRLRDRMGSEGMTAREVNRVFSGTEKRDGVHEAAVDYLIGGGEWINDGGRYRGA